MSENQNSGDCERRVTPLERFFTWSSYAIVTMVARIRARIRGRVTENMLGKAVSKVRLRHPNLRVRNWPKG